MKSREKPFQTRDRYVTRLFCSVVVEASLSLNDSCRPLRYQALHTPLGTSTSLPRKTEQRRQFFISLPRMQVPVFRYHESVSPIEYSTLHIYYPGKLIPTQSTRTQRCSAVQRMAHLFLAMVKGVKPRPLRLTFSRLHLIYFYFSAYPAPQLDANENAWLSFGRTWSRERAAGFVICACACASA